jgi:plasmid maintenance system antidote protein VapI
MRKSFKKHVPRGRLTPLARILAVKKITQAEFARMVDVKQPTVQRHVSGRGRMREDVIRKYAAALGVEPGEII